MLKIQDMTIERSGEAGWKVYGPNHCGTADQIKDGRLLVKHTIKITCAAKLDDRGFLIDQMGVQKWVESYANAGTNLSCEALARDIGERLMRKLERDNPSCKVTALSVTLNPIPHKASITVRWG